MKNNNIAICSFKSINKPYEVHKYEHRIVSYVGSTPPYYNHHYCVASFSTKQEANNYVNNNKSEKLKVLYNDPLYGLTNI